MCLPSVSVRVVGVEHLIGFSFFYFFLLSNWYASSLGSGILFPTSRAQDRLSLNPKPTFPTLSVNGRLHIVVHTKEGTY